MSWRLRSLVGLAAIAGSAVAGAVDLGLQHDPFVRPGAALGAGALAASGDAAPLAWPPVLGAVLVAGRDSLVMIEGRRLRLGESIDGYRLLQVKPRQAIFGKDGRRFVVDMLPPPAPANGQKKEQE